MRIAEVPVAATYDLRRRVLRDHRPDLPVENPEDDLPGTFHLAALTDDGTVVGIVSYTPQACPERPGAPAIRIRGMAVEPTLRGSGVGARLLEAGLQRARAEGATLAWANGRDVALGFYRRMGFETVGDSFMDIGIPHTRIVRDLSLQSRVDG